MKKYFVLVTVNIFTLVISYGQNSHYWTLQYGNKTLLLSGAVTGSVTDLGSVYYNPGFLALQNNPIFTVTAKLLQFTNTKLEGGFGENIDLARNKLKNAPNLIAGVIKLKFLPKHKFAYSYLTRRTTDLNFTYKNQNLINALPKHDGKELLNSEVTWIENNIEQWAGFTWSYPLNKNMSIGISNFVAISISNSTFDIDLSAIANDNHIVSYNKKQELNFINIGTLFKIGYAIRYPIISAGITITTPKINIGGNGSFSTKKILVGTDTNYTNGSTNIYEANVQDGLKSKLKSPFSISAGIGINIKKLTIHLSGEWFDNVSKYNIIKPKKFIGQTSGNEIEYAVVEELLSVVNVGIAFEYKMDNNIHFYCGFSTDFSASPNNSSLFFEQTSEIYYSTFHSNIYHYSGGIGFNVKRVNITIGMSYNYSNNDISSPINIPDNENNQPIKNGNSATLQNKTWKLLFGLSFPFSEKKKNIDIK